jgi:hypothetical protein
MRYFATLVLFSVLLAAVPGIFTQDYAWADEFDGDWTVQIVTERGACDHTYSYNVSVMQGTIFYKALTSVSLSGTVSPQGAVVVHITHFDEGARGTGHLRETTGAGSWRGVGKNGECSGRWEAHRH